MSGQQQRALRLEDLRPLLEKHYPNRKQLEKDLIAVISHTRSLVAKVADYGIALCSPSFRS
jgi:hypothetical protein